MPGSLFYRWKAEEDLASIYRFLAERNPERAYEFVASIEDRCQTLLDFPRQGRARDDLGAGVRIVPYARRVVVAYREIDGGTEIIRVFYGGRDFEALMRDDPTA